MDMSCPTKAGEMLTNSKTQPEEPHRIIQMLSSDHVVQLVVLPFVQTSQCQSSRARGNQDFSSTDGFWAQQDTPLIFPKTMRCESTPSAIPVYTDASGAGILQKDNWQGKVVYNQRQKDILQAWFEHNPYPDKATRKQLAKETGIPESKIQKTRVYSNPSNKEYFPKETRQDQTSIKRFQSTILVQAFERNRFPDITTRKKLAKQTGIRESRIQGDFTTDILYDIAIKYIKQ
ncbi:Double Homeobox Protein B [Manis pentadactyla]|nr:Double Homeobox Protein B [Manis pentadactyla]